MTRLILTMAAAALLSILTLPAHGAEVLSIKGNRNIKSFGEAKKLLPKIHQGHLETIYCGCKVYGKEVNTNSCGQSFDGQSARFSKLEWEHVVPAERLGRSTIAWSRGSDVCDGKRGRKCAAKASALFRQMESDLYNLYPESGGVNAARSNKPPVTSLSSEGKRFGSCETLVGREGFLPRKVVRGDIARTYLYMSEVYDIPLSGVEFMMFKTWSEQDPVDAWECERARRIKKVQGNSNPTLELACANKS